MGTGMISTYWITKIFEFPFAIFIIIIVVGFATHNIVRDYDTTELEISFVKDRLQFCLSHGVFENLEKECLDNRNYAIKIKGDEELIINEELYKHRPLCSVKTQFSCKTVTVFYDGGYRDVDIMVERVTNA